MGQHDLSYRLFFAHRRMIQDLLREIVGERWVECIDLDSGERVDASFVSPKHENRESDVIWKSAFDAEDLAALNSPVADLFRIEKSDGWSEVRESVRRLRQSLPPAEADLRQAFETWLKKVVMPRLGLSQEEVSAEATLEEVDTMLAEKIDRWNQELREKALQEGRQEGRQEGEARILLRQLRLKFGPLEFEVEELVRSADADRLLGWSERILTAENLQDVFRD